MIGKISGLLAVLLVVTVSAQDQDLQAAAASAKSSPSFSSAQALEGDISRDGAYAPAAPAYGGNDYGYEASADTSYGGGYGDDKLGGFVHALTAFLPIGLFLAAVVPNVITVNSGRRRRSNEAEEAQDEVTFPILDMITSYGMRSLQEPSCQAKITCEMGSMGGLPEANGVQRALWMGANYVPNNVARLVGVERLARAIQKRDCAEFACGSK